MELLEALEAVLAQNSCICHAAGMPAVEPTLQIELFQIRPISIKCQLKFIRGRRKTKHSDPGETRAALWWLPALPGAAELQCRNSPAAGSPAAPPRFPFRGWDCVSSTAAPGAPQSPSGLLQLGFASSREGWVRNLCRGLEPGILHRVPGLRTATPHPPVAVWQRLVHK